MFIPLQQNREQNNHNVTIASKSIENVTKYKYFNCMQEAVKSRLNSDNACNLLVQNFYIVLFLIKKNLKIRIQKKTIIFPAVLCGCETNSFMLREEHGLMVSEHGMLRKMFGSKGEK